MKKTSLALAFMTTVSGPICAQSSVTIFGVVDAGVGRITATGAGHATGLVTGGNSNSRMGFRGTEDLGGGLAASFWIEGEIQADNGNAAGGFNFQRRSTVSLSGPVGELRLGRDFAPSYLNMISFDSASQRSFGVIESYGPATGAMTASGAPFTYFRNSNSVTYILPASLGGFYGTAQYSMGERNSNTVATVTNSKKQGNYLGGRTGYTDGALDVAASYGVFYDIARADSYIADYKIKNIGASYDFGFAKALVLVQSETMNGNVTLPQFKFNTYSAGFTAPVGPALIRGSVSRYDNKSANTPSLDATKVSIGVSYNLSKRSAVYAEAARVNNQGAANYVVGGIGGSIAGAAAPSAGGNSTGYVVGVRHAF